MSGLAEDALPDDRARMVAFRLLQQVSLADAYANLALPKLLADSGLDGRDAALATELGYGTLRAQGTIDEILRRCSSRELDDISDAVLDVLRLGAYQLLRTRIPTHAAVSTSVDLARSSGQSRAAGFVNAVLRKVAARDYEAWCRQITASASELGQLAVRYSHPGWIVGAFQAALGDRGDEIADALAADDTRPQTHLVAWPGRIERAELLAEADGVAGPYSPFAVRLNRGDPGRIAAVRDRRAAVQDEGSQLCALAMTQLPLEGPDERWLDLCAAPGGKAALLAGLASIRGAQLSANELHSHRARLLAQAVQGWPVEVTVSDARELPSDDRGFDRILLDAPCTGLGALRRRPEARWRRQPEDVAELVQLQSELLSAAVRLLRPGGVLAYVTCSPHPAETTEVIRAALATEPVELLDARASFARSADADLGMGADTESGEPRTVQLWPHRHGTDAMFFAGLRRTN